jgi:DnaJ-class molecular chaperone
MADDYYATLGVSRNATPDEIHTAYRSLARRYHPDMNPGDEAAKKKFQSVQQAYEVLKDPKKRELFDRYGPSFESMGAGGGGPWRARPGAGPSGGFTEFDINEMFGEELGAGGGFADLFRQFTGRTPRRESPGAAPRGLDVQTELEVPFRTAIVGGTAQLNVRRHTGKVETINVKIPAGIQDGKKIRLRGQGDLGPGGKRGDILMIVRVAPHPSFQRQGRDLIVKVPLTLKEALLGSRVDVPTPKGVVTLTIPPGTSGGKRLRIKGHGVPSANGGGDLFAEIQIVLPDTIDEATKEALSKLDLDGPPNPRGHLVW